MFWKSVALTALGVALSGCAGLKFYDGPNLKVAQEVGLKSYYSKPYILVARDGTDKVASINIVYLPDLEHPVYAKAQSGYGSANLSLAFSNGTITSFGQQTDTKIPDTITSIAGLGTAYGGVVKSLADAAAAKATAAQKQAGEVSKHADEVKTIATNLAALAGSPRFIGAYPATLKTVAAGLYTPASQDGKTAASGIAVQMTLPSPNASKISKDLGALIKQLKTVKTPANPSEGEKPDWNTLSALEDQLDAIADDLKPEKPDTPVLTLYEVIMANGVTTLKEVSLPKSLL